ncbi:MAG: DoxX family protein [Balneolaceae bacterium]|nr:DoxX family protein [Balneolaceae bacterium]
MRTQSAKYRNIGLLILRIGLGTMFILHGYPKLFGGPVVWEQVGAATGVLGVDVLPVALGFLAGITEFFGGIFLLLGIFYRPTLGFLIFVMAIAASTHIASGDPFSIISHPIEISIVFIAMLFLGPGKYSLKNRLSTRQRRW